MVSVVKHLEQTLANVSESIASDLERLSECNNRIEAINKRIEIGQASEIQLKKAIQKLKED